MIFDFKLFEFNLLFSEIFIFLSVINIILFLLFIIYYFFLSAVNLSKLLLFKKNLLFSLITAFFLHLNNITNLNFLLLLLITNLFFIIIFNYLILNSSSVFF